MKYRHSASLDKIDFPAVKALGEPSHERTTQGACRLAWPILRGWGPRDPGSNPGWPTISVEAEAIFYGFSYNKRAPFRGQPHLTGHGSGGHR